PVVARHRGHARRDPEGRELLERVEHRLPGEADLLVERQRRAPDVRPALRLEALDVVAEPRDVDPRDLDALLEELAEQVRGLGDRLEGALDGALRAVAV